MPSGGGGGGSASAGQERVANDSANIMEALSPTNPDSPLVPLSNQTMALFNQISPNIGGTPNPNSPANDPNVGALKTLAGATIPAAQTGQLTPGMEEYVQNYVNDAEAGVRGSYASKGLSGSTMEAQDESAVEGRAAGMRGQMAEQLSQLGMSAETSYQDIQNAWYSLAEGTLQSDAQIYTSFVNSSLAAGGTAGSQYASLAQQRLAADQQQSQEISSAATAVATIAAIALL